MHEDSEKLPSLEYAAPEKTPNRPLGVFGAVGYLLIPIVTLEIAVLYLFRNILLGLIFFPLALSWLIVSILRLAKHYRV